MDQKKVRQYGKYFGSIDFECNHEVTAEAFQRAPDKPVIGTFMIAGRSYEVTWDELECIEETAKAAREVVMKRYRLGMMGRTSM
jgi:hypothetical protein